MIDRAKLQDVLRCYKRDFVSFMWNGKEYTWWKNEQYKWKAVKHFQEHWDVNAENFAEMLKAALSKTSNLLVSVNNFPRGMIEGFAKSSPEEVRSMFIDLYDEGKDVYERINAFKQQSAVMLKKYGGDAKQHYQYENAICTYLWLRYPDKYYIYKYSILQKVSEILASDYHFKQGAYADNIRNFLRMYDEISAALKEDTGLVDLFKANLTDSCYDDPELKTLTVDLCFYIANFYEERSEPPVENEWFPDPAVYTPNISVEQWNALLCDPAVFDENSLKVIKAFYEVGGAATCSELAEKYGGTPMHYSGIVSGLAKRVQKCTDCQMIPDDLRDNAKWWTILFVGKYADKNQPGVYIWKLRSELKSALDAVDLSGIDPYYKPSSGEDCGYWWLNANPKIWSFSDIAVDEVQSYTLFNENGNKRRIFQNFLDAKAGDKIICYESNPVKQIVAIGSINAENDGEQIYIQKDEGLASPIDYAVLKDCPELAQMEFFQNPNGSLFRLTQAEYEFILDMIRDENPVVSEEKAKAYTKQDFLSEVYMTEERYDALSGVLQNKLNIILQGAPGVGKTFAARRLAWSIMGEKDDSRIEFVQFHQNYSYEDFMMGYKPAGDSFELKYGIFYRFCQKAQNQPDKPFFFIIDEINRGNMSKIFGELLMLIEKDYRGTKATLAYNGMPFSVPKNLYIIGMMNTADRSLAMIDYALRRRFSFFDIEPGFDSQGFLAYQNSLNNETLNALIAKVKDMNNEISLDKSLGKGFCIGHSYFCGRTNCTEEWLHAVVDYDILPMLREYWFDETNKLQRWENILQGVFQS